MAKTLRFILSHPLGKQRPLTALSRFARWQLSARTGLGPTVVPFVNDAVLLVSRGMTGATGNVYVGLHECDDMGFFLHFLRPEDLFLDVGANVGSYTVLAAKATGSECVSVEPIAATFRHLMDNIRLNAIDARVQGYCVALGSERGTLRFSTDLDTMNHVVDEGYRGTQERVDVVPLDELLGDRAPVAMKIDVEGFELEVLRGAPRLLANPALRVVLIETNDLNERYRDTSDLSAVGMLEAAGFSLYRYDACTRQLEQCAGGVTPASTGNSLYLRDPDFVRHRLHTAGSFRIGPWKL